MFNSSTAAASRPRLGSEAGDQTSEAGAGVDSDCPFEVTATELQVVEEMSLKHVMECSQMRPRDDVDRPANLQTPLLGRDFQQSPTTVPKGIQILQQ